MSKALLVLIFILMLTSMLFAEPTAEQKTAYIKRAYDIYQKLLQGDLSVANEIDWPSIVLFDNEPGGEDYQKLTTDQQRQEFRDNFIKQFAKVCYREISADMRAPRSWEYRDIDENGFVVYADDYSFYFNMGFFRKGDRIWLADVFKSDLYESTPSTPSSGSSNGSSSNDYDDEDDDW